MERSIRARRTAGDARRRRRSARAQSSGASQRALGHADAGAARHARPLARDAARSGARRHRRRYGLLRRRRHRWHGRAGRRRRRTRPAAAAATTAARAHAAVRTTLARASALRRPTIAALPGPAARGMSIALSCDIRVMAERRLRDDGRPQRRPRRRRRRHVAAAAPRRRRRRRSCSTSPASEVDAPRVRRALGIAQRVVPAGVRSRTKSEALATLHRRRAWPIAGWRG